MSCCNSIGIHSCLSRWTASKRITDFHYDPIPLGPPEQLAPEVILDNAAAYRNRLATRRTVRDFSDEPIDRAVIEACVLSAGTVPSGANTNHRTLPV